MVDRSGPEFRSYLELYERASLLELGTLADQARWQLHPENVVTYIVDRNINYTNVCVADCKFCAFYRRPKHLEGYVLSFEEIGRKIDEVKALGGVQILMQGGHNPYIPFQWYLDLMRYIKRHHPIHIHAFSPSEIDFFAGRFGMTIDEVIRELVAAGLDSVPGGGGEILVQEVRDRVARKKAGADRWLEVMETAHRLGLKTSVTMMYGLGETLADRIEHLFRVREVQARTGGFTAFICWPLQPEHTEMADTPKTDAVTYLRTQAIARIVLDNVTASVFGVSAISVCSGWSGQQMNAVKPPVRACTSRTRNRCSMRSARVSPRPYIIVTDVFRPSRCAVSITSSHRSAPAFFLATR